MRINLFLTIFLFSFYCFSQVKDDFSDGDFTHNPTWTGDIDKFVVNKAGELRLNDKEEKRGYAYLSTPSSILENTTWEFYVHLYFNPTVNNYAKFYLASSSPDLMNELDGYFLLIGGKDDNVSLYRQDGQDVAELIKGSSIMAGSSSPQLLVKVICDENGVWKLYTQLLNVNETFIKEGEAKDSSVTNCSYVGLSCHYTSSRNTAFAFDNILVKSNTDTSGGGIEEPEIPENPNSGDMEPPRLLTVFADSDSTITLSFDEEINISKALFSLSDNHKEKRRNISKDKKQVELTITNKFIDNKEYSLFISNIYDIAGNRMNDLWVSFTYYDLSLQSVEFGDVIFNEIMANPKGAASLPEVEYIELYNRTDKPVNLTNWKFYYGNKSYDMGKIVIPSYSYAVLCNDKKSELLSESGVVANGIKSFPELANTGKLLWLADARGKVIAWVEYSDEWYKDSFKKKGGFSLECIDSNNLTNDFSNWQATVDESGGTPGKDNSVKDNNPDEMAAKVSYAYLIAPDTISICFSKPMDILSLEKKNNYTIRTGDFSINSVIPSIPTGRNVSLGLSKKLVEGETIEIELNDLIDISGFDLEGDLIVKTGFPANALPGDILFNEVLFNPLPGGSDYVEIYNNSDKYINLNTLYFSSRQQSGNINEGIIVSNVPRVLSPYSYLCFTKDVSSVCSQYECRDDCMVSLSKLPSLPDDKGNILLVSSSGQVIDEFVYTEKMHTAFLDNKEGVALEKVFPDGNSLIPSNWLSASSTSGGGTPGYINSQYRDISDQSSNGFWLENKSFSPDGDGFEDVLTIFYKITEENMVANIKVYDASGRFVCDIADNFRLEPEGAFVWDGREANGSLARIGLYIIYVEVYSPEGNMKQYKFGCALGRN